MMTMKYKVSELEGALLDAAVAKAEGIEVVETGPSLTRWSQDRGCWRGWNPSTDWRDGGPLIERERIKLLPPQADRGRWLAECFQGKPHFGWAEADAPLIAAMRAYVASKLGDEVELP
jgi:hypothetical protein